MDIILSLVPILIVLIGIIVLNKPSSIVAPIAFVVTFRIGGIRRRRGLSQMALAEQIEKAPTFISSIETGQRGMSIETFVSIANALNVSADALLIDSIENTERISGSFFAAAAFDCNEFERRVLLELLIASKEAIRKNKRFLRYEDVK